MMTIKNDDDDDNHVDDDDDDLTTMKMAVMKMILDCDHRATIMASQS
jgi:hypothetical protein